jgi:hypothetical protein
MAQKRLSDELFKKLLFEELNSGNEKAHLKTNFFQLVQTKYSCDKTRALKLHDLYYPEWVNLQDKANNEATIKGAEKIAKKHNITRDKLVEELNEIKELAKVPDNFGKINASAVIKAIEVQAKLLGLNEAEKVENTIKGVDTIFKINKDGK